MFDNERLDNDINAAIRGTEREIFFEAVDGAERDDGTDIVDEMSEVEGWDGRPLSMTEIAETNISGHRDTDRPVETAEELSVHQENERLRAQLAEQNDAIQQFIERPMAEERRAAQREQFRQQLQSRYDLTHLGVDDAGLDRFIDDLQADQQAQSSLQEARVNASFEAARQRYGEDFEQVYDSIINMDPRNPLARSIVDNVRNARDPGEAAMAWHGSDVVDGLSNGNPAPFMARGRTAAVRRASRAATRHENILAGWGDRETEADVFDSVMED